MINLKQTFKSPNGVDYLKMNATPEEAKNEVKETLKDILLDCLAYFPVQNKTQVFYINALATKILNSGGEVEFNGEETSFLDGVLWKATRKEIPPRPGKRDPDVEVSSEGMFIPFLMGQVLLALGIKE